jgi:ATP-dependent DNA helicase RecG
MAKRPIDSRLDFLSPISLVPGLGPKRLDALRGIGIETIRDLLYYFPRRYINRSTIIPLNTIADYIGKTCTIIGSIEKCHLERGRTPRLRALVSDGSGSIELLWFHGVQFIKNSIKNGKRFLLTGTVSKYTAIQMVHPQMEPLKSDETVAAHPYLPQYSLSSEMREAGLSQKVIVKSLDWIFANLRHYPALLPQPIEEKHSFPSLSDCLFYQHFPRDVLKLEKFRQRLAYEELYQLALDLRWSRKAFALPGHAHTKRTLMQRFIEMLPFSLTDGQEEALHTLLSDISKPRRMHRLLHGDVGCGKTVVAFLSCLPVLEDGCQIAWLTPTEILALQTFKTIEAWCKNLGIKPVLIKSGQSAQERRTLLESLRTGEAHCIIGTHALLGAQVHFSNLGMIVIDEQHRFGAGQRLSLAEKAPAADFLLMSATPIPKTLAQTLYGDLDITSIRELPKGRLPVQTHIVPEDKRDGMEQFMVERAALGERIFYVVPRIEDDGETSDLRDVNSVKASLSKGLCKNISSAAVHGNIETEKLTELMQSFTNGTVALLVSTTVIEVGVDVPEATIIVIENAERFGLSQLHQLRGRVGRGNAQGYCFLFVSADASIVSFNRIKQFCKMHSGFDVAELDLSLRGPGEIIGLKQSGWNDLKIADILKDASLFSEIQQEIEKLLIR